ncbi:Novel toxin 21 [Amycolatopsis pretoriensis]|uniref:Novel toxin 21 n=1 Tax=Amycolatopsis pretoriensis TaxID=218821 RepID=A0A1H5Q7M5_9PSEU|nr:toxin C-terminal domain-containing protein [Amycolatopsis pretoriensis]SEF22045.1 Novel toxin 21 [Amycolatopsis pretoriensis]
MATRRDQAPREPSAQPARTAGPARRTSPPALLRLQASAGNAAVSGLVALQRQGCPAPPVAPAGVTPASDPKFRSLTKDVGARAGTAKAHPPAGAEVKKAQDAAVAPADDKDAQAKAAQADKMAAAKPAGFDKAGFIAAVNAAIAKQAPKNLDEADKFAASGKADQVKTEVLGKVTSGKDASAKDVTDRTKEAPDPSRAVEKPVTPLPPAPAPPALAPPDPRKATPDKAPAEQTDLRADQCETHGAMAAAGVTEQQLAQSNEPEFTGALAAKQEGEQHTASAPAAVRESEAGQLAAVTGAAQASGQAAMAGMTGARSTSGQRGQAAKSATKAKDEQDRARITGEIKAIFDETKTKVEGVLGALDDQVAKKFEAGEAQAKAAFTADHQARMKRYKDERYDGISGAARWAYDLFADLPAEANNLFLEAKKVYEVKMQGVISEIADFVGQQLGEAKQLISDGRARVKQKVESQSPALRKIAGEAAKEFGGQFDDLEKSVDEKQQSLVEDLAQKYSEARTAVDEEIKTLQAENKGLWSKAKEAVGGAIETILALKNMLLGVLSRAANAVELIIKKPIEFLGNLVNAVKTGVVNFGANIVQHLKEGLKGWLLGNLASAGIEIPEALDAKGILKMVLSILGLTWASVRARILRFIPEPVLAKLEQTLGVVKILITEGVPGLWRWVVEKLGDLKEMVLGQIKEFVIEKIVKAGITWIISLLNPAAAFIKACKAIYDIVMFFVEKASQIKEFVDSVLDSVESIARGGAGAVAGLIERTLGRALPMVLGFLASLLGLGGISEKIKSVLEKVQAPVGKVVDSVVGTVVKAGKKIWSKLKGGKKKTDDAHPATAPVVKTLSMRGHSHTVTFKPGAAVTLASSEGGLVAKVLARQNAIKDDDPKPTAELAALQDILDKARRSQDLYRKKGVDDPEFSRSCEAVIVAISSYGQNFNKDDIDPKPKSTEEEGRWEKWDGMAKALGFQTTNYKSHGAPVYRQGSNRYITPDVDSHIGGVWKMATSVANLGSKRTRMGTYDASLKKIGD